MAVHRQRSELDPVLPESSNPISDLVIDSSTNPSTLYVARNNGVFKSTDGGSTWSNLNWNSNGVQLDVVNSVPYLLAPSAGINKLLLYNSAVAAWTEIRTICPAQTDAGRL